MIKSILLIPISVISVYMAKKNPYFVEKLYSLGIYKYISQPLSKITGIFPFSLAEFLFYGFIVWIVVAIFNVFKSAFLGSKKNMLMHIKKIAAVLSILFFLFVFLWGLNYYRLPLFQSANLDKKNFTSKDLEELCIYLIEKSNTYRNEIEENSVGVMKLSQGKKTALTKIQEGYVNISKKYAFLEGNYGKPKIVMASKLMSYAGIAGIFFPFTIEANVNGDVPDALFPSNIAHEMAHQRGFAREDEANFISFLACTSTSNVEYKYSGTLLALIHSMNALHKTDFHRARKLSNLYSPALKRDLANISAYWKKFEGPVERASTKLNNAYLKANNQEDGVESYGRMVDLLLLYYNSEILD